jgi:hypothetical protein
MFLIENYFCYLLCHIFVVLMYSFWNKNYMHTQISLYRVFQNSRIPNSEHGRKGPSGARKILRKKIALPGEDISTLILFNT